MKRSFSVALASACCVAAGATLYGPVLARLAADWRTDDNYSHGFLIIPVAIYLVLQRRRALRVTPLAPSAVGLCAIAASLALLVVGVLGAELFLTRISLLGVLAGTTLFVLGRWHLRILAFPIGFLALMVPLPAIVLNEITFPLQLVASRLGEAVVSAAGIPVLREGNVIVLPAMSLEVAEACSGIRSLISLLTLGIVYAELAAPAPLARLALAAATVPVAIVANGLRVAGTGIAAHVYGSAAAEGFFHTFSGWLVFISAFAMLLALHQASRFTARTWRSVVRHPARERVTA